MKMSSQELIHSINNQLTVVMGRAELLSNAPVNEETQRVCLEIRTAAGKLNLLLQQYMNISHTNQAS
jgi:signal transduction histidine kinase